MSAFDKPKREDCGADRYTPSSSLAAAAPLSPGHTHEAPNLQPGPAEAGPFPRGLGGDPVGAAAVLSHWADAPSAPRVAGPLGQAQQEHAGWNLGDAWRGIKSTATRGYNKVSGWTNAAGSYLQRAERKYDHGVDAAESQLQRPSQWIAEQTHGSPGVEGAAQGYASLSKHATHLLGGIFKGAGSAAFGLGNAAVHPLDTMRGLATMGSHLPISPFWALRQGYKQATGLYDMAARGADPSAALDPMSALKEDADYWKGVGSQLIAPYRASVNEGKPMEAIGRGAFDVGSLFFGAGEAKAAAEAGELSKAAELSNAAKVGDVTKAAEVSKAAEVTNLGEVAELAKAGEGADAASATKAVIAEPAPPKYHSVYEDGHRVPQHGEPARLPEGPDPRAEGAHTRLRWDEQSPARSGQGTGRIYQGREFDPHGNPVRDIDFTSPTYPSGRPRPDHLPPPHEHRWFLNDPKNPRSGYKRSKNPTPFEP